MNRSEPEYVADFRRIVGNFFIWWTIFWSQIHLDCLRKLNDGDCLGRDHTEVAVYDQGTRISVSVFESFSTLLDGTLTSKNAGGNCTYPTFMVNPQYHLHIHPKQPSASASRADKKANVGLTIQARRDVSVNVAVMWSQGERIVE